MEKTVKFGVIGVNGFGRSHIMSIKENKSTDLVMICDPVEEIAKKASEEFDVPYMTDVDEFLKIPQMDAVSVVTPDQTHRDVVTRALRAGKHVLCEKPMSIKLEDSKEMLRVQKETGKYLMVGQICRFTPGFVLAKRLYDEGEIGELFFVESEYAHDYTGMPTSWRFDPKSPRHGMIGGGCHAVDLLRWIAGNPIETMAYSNKKVLTDCPTDDCTIAILKFPDNVVGKVFCSTGCKRKYTMRTLLYGTKGTIIVDNTSQTLSLFRDEYRESGEFNGDKAVNVETLLPITLNNHNTTSEIAEFAKCILEGKAPKIDGREGAITVSVCESIVKAADEHRIVEIDYDF